MKHDQRGPVETGLVIQNIEPVSSDEPKPDTYVFDGGQNIAGWMRR